MKALRLLPFALALASCVNLSNDDRRAYACNRDAGGQQCTGGYVCSITGRCVDPEIGENTICFQNLDCMGNFKCSITGRCVDPDIGENTICNDTGDCMGDFVCNLEKTCVDPSIGTASKCIVDSDCMGDWRCGVDGVCATPGHDGVPDDATVRYARPMNVTMMSPLSSAFMPAGAQKLAMTNPKDGADERQVASFTRDGGSIVERVRWPSGFSPDLTEFVVREQVPAPPEGIKRLVTRHHSVLALTNTGGFLSWPEGPPGTPPWAPLDAGITPTGVWSLDSINDFVIAQGPTGYWASTTFSSGPLNAQLPPATLVDAVSIGVDGTCAVLAWSDRLRLMVMHPGDQRSVPLGSGSVQSPECTGMSTQMETWPETNILSLRAASDGALAVISRDAGADTVRFVTFKPFEPGGPGALSEACNDAPTPYDGGCTFDSESSALCYPCDTGTLVDLQVEPQTVSHNWVGWARCTLDSGVQEVRRVAANTGKCFPERIPTQNAFSRQSAKPEETNHSRLGGITDDGSLWSGTSPVDAMALTLSAPPTDVTTLKGGPLLVGSALSRYQPGVGFVAMRAGSGASIGSAVQNFSTWVQFNGVVVDTLSLSDNFTRVVAEREDGVALNGMLTLTPDAGGQRWMLYATDDTLYTADVSETLAGGPRAELEFQLTPSPGNPVLAMVPVEATGDSTASVYVLTTAGLSLVTAPTGRRWRATQLDIGDGVAVGLFAENGFARVVFDDGRILSLPSRLLMAQPRVGAVLQDVDTLCGQPVGLFNDGLYRLAAPAPDAGYGTWSQVMPMNGEDGVVLTAPQPLLTPDAGSALWVFEANGRASEVTVTGCQ